MSNDLTPEQFIQWLGGVFKPPPNQQDRIFRAPSLGLYIKLARKNGTPIQVSKDSVTWTNATEEEIKAINGVWMVDMAKAKQVMETHLKILSN